MHLRRESCVNRPVRFGAALAVAALVGLSPSLGATASHPVQAPATQAPPQAPATQAPAPDEASTIAQARALVQQLLAGDTAPLVARFTDQVKAAVSEAQIKQGVAGLPAQVGAFQSQGTARFEAKGPLRVVTVTCQYERAAIEVVIAFDAADRIAGLSMRPAAAPAPPYVPAPYAVATAFKDQPVTVDAGGWPLPGTLSMPAGAGPFPAVVLVHGSGPQDRDSTLGPLKPLRDLAEGLASTRHRRAALREAHEGPSHADDAHDDRDRRGHR